jgi:hypothetical protein
LHEGGDVVVVVDVVMMVVVEASPPARVVIEDLVWSSFLPFFSLTGTVTGQFISKFLLNCDRTGINQSLAVNDRF